MNAQQQAALESLVAVLGGPVFVYAPAAGEMYVGFAGPDGPVIRAWGVPAEALAVLRGSPLAGTRPQ